MPDVPANNGAPTAANQSGGQAVDNRSSTGYNTGLGLTNHDLQHGVKHLVPVVTPLRGEAIITNPRGSK